MSGSTFRSRTCRCGTPSGHQFLINRILFHVQQTYQFFVTIFTLWIKHRYDSTLVWSYIHFLFEGFFCTSIGECLVWTINEWQRNIYQPFHTLRLNFSTISPYPMRVVLSDTVRRFEEINTQIHDGVCAEPTSPLCSRRRIGACRGTLREHWFGQCFWCNVIFHQRDLHVHDWKRLGVSSWLNFYPSKHGTSCALDARSSPRNFGRSNAVHHFYRARER